MPLSVREDSRKGKVLLAIAGAAAVAAVFAWMLGNPMAGPGDNQMAAGPSQESAAASRLSFSSLASAGSPVRGDPSAPVTIVEFADFQCPTCGRYTRDTAPQIIEQYVATGKASIVYKHFPIRGPDSVAASMASQCAGDQGKFWEFHDLLFSNQEAENSGWASAGNMKRFATELGLERQEFDSCLDSEKYMAFVEADFAFAREIGATGTPTFVIVKSDGSEPEGILGAQPLGSFKAVLDRKIG